MKKLIISIIIILILPLLLTSILDKKKTKIDESNSRNVELARQVRDLSFENKQLKDLRKQEVHNNTILVKENMKLQDLLKDVADRTIACPVDSEKIVLNKIKELVRDYQSKN